ncbi:MAG TPA: hypothetical protein VIL32_13930 [Steroidobacteraceae bacterium]
MSSLVDSLADVRAKNDPKTQIRRYFVAGHRVEHVRHPQGHSTWSCECPEFTGRRVQGGERWCQHVERVAATVQLGDLLQNPALILSATSY